MKRLHVIMGAWIACWLLAPAVAEEEGQQRRGQVFDREKILKQFDKDGDGRLNEQERAAAKQHFTKKRRGQADNNGGSRRIPKEVLKRFDKDGDGKLNERERAAAMKAREQFMKKNGSRGGSRPNMKEILAKFDKNGDGKLDESERVAARQAMGRMRQQRGAGAPSTSGAKTRKPRVDKKELLKKFDADGDGKLNGEERATARQEFQNRKKS